MHTILDILNLSTEYLKQKGIQNSRRQAEELLGEALAIGRIGLYLQHDRPIDDHELNQCRDWLKRRGAGEPLQYICCGVDFYHCRIKLNSDVLIPRQETEILVDKIVKELATVSVKDKVLWDICCGSGCIGLALKKQFPELKVVLSDISAEALVLAKENAYFNQVEVEFLQGDLTKPFQGLQADYIVCNPPYISHQDYINLDPEVRKYEPKQALLAGETGIEFYNRLCTELPPLLKKCGKVWFEIGDGQGDNLKKLFFAKGWKLCQVDCDWSGRQRFFSLEIE